MRPKSIVWFERLYVTSVAIDALLLGLSWWFWDLIMPGTNADALFARQALWCFLRLALGLFVSRLRSRIAQVLIIAATLWSMLGALQIGWTAVHWIYRIPGPAILALSALAISMTFTPAARAWFRREWRPPDPVRQTFE